MENRLTLSLVGPYSSFHADVRSSRQCVTKLEECLGEASGPSFFISGFVLCTCLLPKSPMHSYLR